MKPVYIMLSPNVEIPLFRGKLKLSKYDMPEVTCEGEGTIQVEWRPSPSISFKLNCEDISHISYAQIPIGPTKLESAEGLRFNLPVFVRNFHGYRVEGRNHAAAIILGNIAYPITVPQAPSKCNEVKFHLINFIGCSNETIELDYGDWQIKIKEIDNVRPIYDLLEKQGGYSITHMGLLRLKKGAFKFEDVCNQLDALYYFCAFLSGRWCGPILSVGFTNGAKSWEMWDVITEEGYAILDKLDKTGKQNRKIVSSARDRLRLTSRISGWEWTDLVTITEVKQIFHGFMKKWEDVSWKNSLKTAIFLYVEANQGSGGTEGAIILAQSALELLAAQDAGENRRTQADERIRQLLKGKKIPIEIPLDSADLRNFCEKELTHERNRDGPRIITYIRNKITHSTGADTRCLQNIEDKIKLQTLWLGIWYLEMTLLCFFEYTGKYANRLWRFREESFKGGLGFYQQVPWINSTENQSQNRDMK